MLKNRAILLLIILCITGRTSAQEVMIGENYWRLFSGVTLSRLRGDSYVSGRYPGFTIGGTYAIAISDNSPFYFEGGLSVSKCGAVDMGYIGGYDTNYRFKNYSFKAPLVVIFSLRVTPLVAICLNVGAYIGVALDGEISGCDSSVNPYSGGNIHIRDGNTIATEPIFRRFDAGSSAGVAAIISRFSLNIAYDIGLVNQFTPLFSQRGYYLTSQVLNFTVGYIF